MFNVEKLLKYFPSNMIQETGENKEKHAESLSSL